MAQRQCQDCQLCCKIVPVREIAKPANTKCQHQKFGKGCLLHGTANMPASCRLWDCGWLSGKDTADIARPDRAHYVIDPMPDFATATHNESGKVTTIPLIQIWIDPRYPEAHRDTALRAYLSRRGDEGFCAIIRTGAKKDFMLVPPQFTEDGQWLEYRSETFDPVEHTAAEIVKALGVTAVDHITGEVFLP